MLELKLRCEKTRLELMNAPEPLTEGLTNYAKITFQLGSDWDGLGVTASFKRVIDQQTYTVNVSNRECVIPWEAFVYPVTEVSIRGTSEEKTVTSTILRLEIRRTLGGGEMPGEPTKDIYDQIMEAAQAAEDKADAVFQAAEAGEFDGEPGADGATPEIGENGNWYINEVDTGKPSRGEKGDKGDTGADGDAPEIGENGNWHIGGTDTGKPSRGEKGDPGEDGAAATVAIGTVTTGDPGTSASVVNSGTASAAVLDITIPRGDKGETGDGGVPDDGETGQVLTKTETGAEWADAPETGLPLTGGTLSGNVTVSTGTAEPNVVLQRTVDGVPCELVARIDSEAVAGLRYKVNGATVNDLYLEQTKTRLRKPLDAASGGVPTAGTAGQVLTKTESSHEWADLPDILDPQEIRDMIDAPIIDVQGAEATLKAPDETPVVLGVEGGGTGATTASEARGNLGALGYETKTGEIVEFDIVSDECPVNSMKVYGQTRQNLWANPNMTSNGITATANEDGSITVSGTARAAAFLYVASYALRPSGTYTLSIDKEPDGFEARIEQDGASGNLGVPYRLVAEVGGASRTMEANMTRVYCVIGVASGATVSGTYRIMLNEGSEAEPWCPPGLNSVGSLEIVTAGKNLWASKAFTDGGITAVVNDDGSVTLDGTSTSSAFDGKRTVTGFLPPGEYTLSVDRTADENASFFVRAVVYGAEMTLMAVRHSSRTFTIPVGTSNVICGVQVVQGDEVHGTFRVQLERGATVTDWVPPVAVTSTPIDLDGNQLCSLSDGTRDELRIDETGAVSVDVRTHTEVLDGSSDETWYLQTADNGNGIANFQHYVGGITGNSNALCDVFPITTSSISSTTFASVMVTSTDIYIRLRTSTASTVEELRSFLADNPVTVAYESSAPQEISLGSVELPKLERGYAQVFASSNVPAELSATVLDVPVIPVSQGGTGANSAEQARENLGITPANIGAADSDHTHTGFASSDHEHAIADVSGLQSALDGKAAASHSHTLASLVGSTASNKEDAREALGIYTGSATVTVEGEWVPWTHAFTTPVNPKNCMIFWNAVYDDAAAPDEDPAVSGGVFNVTDSGFSVGGYMTYGGTLRVFYMLVQM